MSCKSMVNRKIPDGVFTKEPELYVMGGKVVSLRETTEVKDGKVRRTWSDGNGVFTPDDTGLKPKGAVYLGEHAVGVVNQVPMGRDCAGADVALVFDACVAEKLDKMLGLLENLGGGEMTQEQFEQRLARWLETADAKSRLLEMLRGEPVHNLAGDKQGYLLERER